MAKKYKFINHAVVLEDPAIIKLSTSYSIGDDNVKVFAVLEANGSKAYGVDLGEMENTDNWTDENVQKFAEKEIEKHKI